jgi:hypothetical protein
VGFFGICGASDSSTGTPFGACLAPVRDGHVADPLTEFSVRAEPSPDALYTIEVCVFCASQFFSSSCPVQSQIARNPDDFIAAPN